MTILADLSQADLLARIAALEATNAKLKQAQQARLSLKVSDKGAISVYGMGRFPITLYRGQMERLLDAAPTIRAFIEANAESLTTKD